MRLRLPPITYQGQRAQRLNFMRALIEQARTVIGVNRIHMLREGPVQAQSLAKSQAHRSTIRRDNHITTLPTVRFKITELSTGMIGSLTTRQREDCMVILTELPPDQLNKHLELTAPRT